MDTHLRRLERIYQATGAGEDLIRYFAALFRVELVNVFSTSLNNLLINREQTPPQGRQYWGYGAIASLDAPVVIFKCVLCLQRDIIQQSLYPGLALFIYTFSQKKSRCIYCGIEGPHVCERYTNPIGQLGHPWRHGVNLPFRYELYGLEEPLEFWQPSLPRRLGQEHIYTIHQWMIMPYPTEDISRCIAFGDGWFLHRVTQIGQRYSSDFPREFKETPTPDGGVQRRITGKFLTEIHLEDILRAGEHHPADSTGVNLLLDKGIPYAMTQCESVWDSSANIFPIKPEHAPPEPCPELVFNPCEDFALYPEGHQIFVPELDQYVPTGKTITIFSDDYIPRAIKVIDTTTMCGHGFQFGRPMCPPTWSDDAEIAAIFCDSCGRLLPKDHESDDPFHRCKDCERKIRRQDKNNILWLQEFLSEPGEGLFYYCEACTQNEGVDIYHEEEECEHFEECAADGFHYPPPDPRFRCPYCGPSRSEYQSAPLSEFSWYQTPEEALKCCTEIVPWDYSFMEQD